MSDTIKFCSNCNITGINEYADAFKKDSNGFNFNKGFIHPYEIKDNNTNICPYCNKDNDEEKASISVRKIIGIFLRRLFTAFSTASLV